MARYLCTFFSIQQEQHASDEARPWHSEWKGIKHSEMDKEYSLQPFHQVKLQMLIRVLGELFCKLSVNYLRQYYLPLFIHLHFTTLLHMVWYSALIIYFQLSSWNMYHWDSQSKGTSPPDRVCGSNCKIFCQFLQLCLQFSQLCKDPSDKGMCLAATTPLNTNSHGNKPLQIVSWYL